MPATSPFQCRPHPPPTSNVAPVANEFSSPHSQTTARATSIGSAIRLSGVALQMPSRTSFGVPSRIIWVFIAPGQTEFTRTPLAAPNLANIFVKTETAPLVASYGADVILSPP